MTQKTSFENRTSVIGWPWVQTLFDQDGFNANAALCSSHELYEEYGDSAYVVREEWLNQLPAEIIAKITDGILDNDGPSFDNVVETDPEISFLTI